MPNSLVYLYLQLLLDTTTPFRFHYTYDLSYSAQNWISINQYLSKQHLTTLTIVFGVFLGIIFQYRHRVYICFCRTEDRRPTLMVPLSPNA